MYQPPYPYPPVPPMAPPKRRTPWYVTPWAIAGYVVTAVLLWLCGFVLVLATLGSRLAPVAPTPAPTSFALATSTTASHATQSSSIPPATVTPQPGATATVPPTPAPHAITSATLGGPQFAFTSQYGGSTNGVYSGTVNGVPNVSIYPALMPGQDGSPRAYTIVVQPGDSASAWDSSTATRVVVALLPADGVYVRDASWPNGTEHISRSGDLAASFPPAVFTNDAGTQQVPPGTFDWQCFEDQVGSGIDQCVISIGNR